MHSKRIALLALLSLSALAGAQSLDINGIKLGDSEERVTTILRHARCKVEKGQRICDATGTYGESSAIFRFVIKGGTVYSGHAGFDVNSFPAVVEALRLRYGTPTEGRRTPVSLRDYTWSDRRDVLSAVLFGSDKPTIGAVVLQPRSHFEELDRDAKNQRIKRAKNL